MTLSDQQTNALADRFDHVALWIASALELESAAAMRSTCDRLRAVCRQVQEDMPLERDGNDARLMLHLVVALQAAIETRIDTPLQDLAVQANEAPASDRMSIH